jgi:GNAT superfamily N-acetyltransferase
MSSRNVAIASESDADRCFALIMLAFAGDPMSRFLYPDPEIFVANFPRFVRAFGGAAFTSDSAYLIDDAATALWFPPAVELDEEPLMAIMEETVPTARRQQILAIMEEMSRYHPEGPHYYLPLIGTDPTKQGKGYGSELLEHATAICDRQGLPAYLEASSLRSVPLYRRHGFEQLGTIQVGESPPLTPMLRRPR